MMQEHPIFKCFVT